jgi:hypothetical protein
MCFYVSWYPQHSFDVCSMYSDRLTAYAEMVIVAIKWGGFKYQMFFFSSNTSYRQAHKLMLPRNIRNIANLMRELLGKLLENP